MLILLFYLLILKLDNMNLLNPVIGFIGSLGVSEAVIQSVSESSTEVVEVLDEPLVLLIVGCITAVTNLVLYFFKKKKDK